VEDEDVSRVGDASLEFLAEADGVGSFGDAGCVDLGGVRRVKAIVGDGP
jgi:hypothetical protein